MSDVSHVRGDKPVIAGLDRRWREKVVMRNRMPLQFEMSKKEVKEYKKNLGEKMTKRANQGLLIYRGARIKVK